MGLVDFREIALADLVVEVEDIVLYLFAGDFGGRIAICVCVHLCLYLVVIALIL